MTTPRAPRQDLVLGIYDAVLDPALWPDILDRLAHEVGALGIIIFDMTDDAEALSVRTFSSRYERRAIERYLALHVSYEMADQRIFARHSAAADRIEVIGDEVLAPTSAQLAARPNSQAMAQFGILHRAGALLSRDNPGRDRFSIQFSRSHGPLGSGDRAVLGLYLPHLAKAFELSRPIDRWRGLAAGLAATLDRLSIGICLIRPDRAVIAQNSEFRRQVDELGVMAVTRDGRLEVRHPEGRAWLERLTGDPARHGQFGARPRKEALGALRRDDQVSVSVEIAPLGTLEAFGGGRLDGYVVYCLDTSRPVEIDLDGVRRAMGLTAAEADLLGLLAEGLTNREIAGHRDRSVETINTQVKSLLAKADCANRTQLIRRATTIGCRFLA